MSNKSTVKEPKENFSEEDPRYHAWHSAKADKQGGYIVWMNENGEKVYVTVVSKNKNYNRENYKYIDDAKYVGIVIKYINSQLHSDMKEP